MQVVNTFIGLQTIWLRKFMIAAMPKLAALSRFEARKSVEYGILSGISKRSELATYIKGIAMKSSRPAFKMRFLAALSSFFLAASLIIPPGVLAEDFSWPSEDGDSASKSNAQEKRAVEQEGQPTGESAVEESAASSAPALKMEKPEASSASASAAPAPARSAARPAKSKPIVLYGRLDQIAAEADVKMPVLKAQKAQFDSRMPLTASASRLTAGAAENRLYTGVQTRSFPVDFSGVWGGQLKVWRYNSSSLSDRTDPAESRKMEEILRPGKSGNVNFVFRQAGASDIELEPASVRLMIPASESYSYQKMISGNSQMSGLGGMVSKMMANMQIPVILHFGSVSTSGSAEVGISGNQIDQRVVKNSIRRLAPRVVEEQIVTRNHSVVASTGRSKDGYTESVMRFTRQSPNQLYVLAASVDYDAGGNFLRKLIMYGTVQKGVRTDTSIMPQGGQLSGLMGAAGAGGGAGGLGSLGSLSTMMNSMGQGGGGTANYGALLRSLQSGGGAGGYGGMGGYGARGQGFSQVLKSLNMITR